MQQHTMDKIFSVIVIGLAIGCGIVAFGYSYESSYFPRLLSAFIAVMGAVLLVRLQAKGPSDDAETQSKKDQLVAALSVFTGIAAYAFGMQIINFELSTLIFIAGFIYFLGYRNYVVIALVSLGITALLYGVFFEFLAVSRPESLFFE